LNLKYRNGYSLRSRLPEIGLQLNSPHSQIERLRALRGGEETLSSSRLSFEDVDWQDSEQVWQERKRYRRERAKSKTRSSRHRCPRKCCTSLPCTRHSELAPVVLYFTTSATVCGLEHLLLARQRGERKASALFRSEAQESVWGLAHLRQASGGIRPATRPHPCD
jgi:hypothetical protein